jgi:hypothetical protein
MVQAESSELKAFVSVAVLHYNYLLQKRILDLPGRG